MNLELSIMLLQYSHSKFWNSKTECTYEMSPRTLSFEDPSDVWHERPRGDDENTWHLRVPGGLLIQCPQRMYVRW